MQSARASQLEIVAKTKWCHKKIYHISPSSSCTISADKGETTAPAAAEAGANVKLTNQLLESWEIQRSYQEAQRLLMLMSYFSTLTLYPGDARFFWLIFFFNFSILLGKKSKRPINSMRISHISLLDFFPSTRLTVWGWEVCFTLIMTPWRVALVERWTCNKIPAAAIQRKHSVHVDAWTQVERPPYIITLPFKEAYIIRHNEQFSWYLNLHSTEKRRDWSDSCKQASG